MKGVIDRFEGEYAVVEIDRKMVNLPKVMLPPHAREGDIIDIRIAVDKNETAKVKKEIENLMKDVWKE